MGIHPAVLDAVLHAAAWPSTPPDDVAVLLAWRVLPHAAGAARLRARFTALGADAPVMPTPRGCRCWTVRSLVTRRSPLTSCNGVDDGVRWPLIRAAGRGVVTNTNEPQNEIEPAGRAVGGRLEDYCAGGDGAGGVGTPVRRRVMRSAPYNDATKAALESVAAGWPTTPQKRWCPRVARWDWPLPMSPIWLPRRCGPGAVGAGRNPGQTVLIDADAAVDAAALAAVGEPQLLVRAPALRMRHDRPRPLPPLVLPAGESAWRLATGGGGR